MISVIIPTYNRSQLLIRAIKSVVNQTYQNFEIIVINDGSTDDTDEVIKRVLDERITYLRHADNKGAATARNTGIRAAKGEYIAFLDSDDEWLPKKLAKQIKILKSTLSKVGVIYTGSWRIMNHEKFYIPAPTISPKEGNIYNNILCGKYLVPTPAAVVKKVCFEKVGMFDESLPALEEWDLWIRISKHFHFKYIDEPLLISYYTSGSISTNRRIFCKAMKSILKKHFKEFRKNQKALVNFYYRIARLYIGDFLHKMRFIQ